MKKRCKALALVLAFALTLALCGCSTSGARASGNSQQRSLCIVWPTLGIDFYSTMAEGMKEQAEAVGWRVEIKSFDFDSAVQAAQLEDCGAAGVTDIITCAPDPGAVEDVCVRLRQQGVNISFFALAPDNPDAYDSVTVADQFKIGEAIAKNASDWVDTAFSGAEDGSIDAILIEVPADAENAKRAQGMETIRQNAKINVVYTCKLDGETPAEVPGVIDTMVQQYPDTKVVLCHFSSLALAADDAAAEYGQIERDSFGIFSGDWDSQLAGRIQASERGESLIRGTGTYATDAMEIQFHVCTGEYERLLNDQKQYVYPVVRITPRNIKDYLD